MMSWTRIVVTFMLFALTVVVSAHPRYERVENGNTVDVEIRMQNFAKTKENVARHVNEELNVVKERHKRLSDQRRAELETLMALSKMTERLATVTRGGRQLDATKVGRRKRAVFDLNMKNLRKLFRLSGTLAYKGNAAYPVIS